jgi:hypothetical protein
MLLEALAMGVAVTLRDHSDNIGEDEEDERGRREEIGVS